MINFFGKRREKLFNLQSLHFDKLALYVLPRFILEIIEKYFRLEIDGIQNIPAKGKALIVPNHSGWAGLDAIMIGHEIHKRTRRIPRILAHHFWFLGDIKILSEKVGMKEATTENGMKLLKKNNLVIIFPEGERGNFKATKDRYHLQEFRRGFVRMAIQTGSLIIPTIVIGSEEAYINLASLKLTKYIRGQIIPLPLNVLPLPSKWWIHFLEPISLAQYSPNDVSNSDLMHKIAEEVRSKMQNAIDQFLKERKGVFFNVVDHQL